MKTIPPLWIAVLVLALRLGVARAQSPPMFYVNETRLFATASTAAPDLSACFLPGDAAGARGALFPAQSAKFVWFWASLVGYAASRPVTVQVVGLRSRRLVRAWDRHEFPDGVGCVSGSFGIGPLRDRFGDEQLLAQLLVDDDLMASIPFALVPEPFAVGRSLVAVAPNPDAVACDFGATPAASTVNGTGDAVVYLCVDVDLADRRRPASIRFDFRAGTAVVSVFRNDGADLGAATTLFMPVPVRQLMAAGGDRAAFSAEFWYDGRLAAARNFTLQTAGGAVRFCPSPANCSSAT